MRIYLILLTSLTIGIQTAAQFRLPSFDLEIKGGFSNLTTLLDQGRDFTYNAAAGTASVNFHLGQHLSIGGFISKSLNGKIQGNDEHDAYDAAHQIYGVSLRLSTGRKPRLRPYIQLSYAKQEMYFDLGDFRVANSTTVLGASVGLMIKLGDRIYLIIPEITTRFRSETFFFETANPLFIEINGGLAYNFTKRK